MRQYLKQAMAEHASPLPQVDAMLETDASSAEYILATVLPRGVMWRALELAAEEALAAKAVIQRAITHMEQVEIGDSGDPRDGW